MGFKSVLGKIGKIALTAAPYVAAPFTGGASLALTGLANKGVQKWSEHDAKVAESKGLAPSNFDKVLGKVGGYAGLASSFMPTGALGAVGMLGKAGSAASKVGSAVNTASKVGQVASKTSKVADVLGKVGKVASIAGPAIGGAMAIKNAIGNDGGRGIGPSDSVVGSAVPRGSSNNSGPGFAKYQQGMDLNVPNLANSIAAGRNAATKDQGFRRGYDVTTRIGEPDDEGKYETVTSRMPKINSDFGRPQRDMGSLIGGNASRRNRKAS
jgi:hypothetical protein